MGNTITHAQVLGIIGSSTAAGDGASTFANSWVAKTVLYYQNLHELTSYHDIAQSATTTWLGMPSSFSPPQGVAPTPPLPDPTLNVTRILQLGADVVVVGYPTNDIVFGYTLTQYLSNLRTIYDSVVKAGKVCYITTTQPRNDIPTSVRQLLLEGRDSILNEFPQRTLDFWDPVVDPATLGILAQYGAPDGIHLNDAGHAAIALVAENANIMTQSPLPLTLIDFSARKTGQGVLLQWTTANNGAGDPVLFDVQRSTGNTAFNPVYTTGMETAASGNQSWTDSNCPAGIVFYRLRWLEGTQENYSKIVSIDHSTDRLTIGGLYLSGGSQLVTELVLPAPGKASIDIIDMSGRPVLRKDYTGLPTSATLRIDLPQIANGEYFFRIITSGGKQATKAFVKF
jgi:hypothetical protein